MLIRSSLYTIGSSLLQFVASIGSGIIIARTLGPEGKGQVFLVVQMASLGGMIFSLGLGSSYLFHLRKRLITEHDAISHANLLVVLLLGVGGALYFIGQPLLRHFTGPAVTEYMIAVMLVMGLLNVSTQLSGSILMNAEKGVQWVSWFGAIGSSAYILALIGLVIMLRGGPVSVLIAAIVPLALRQLLITATMLVKLHLPLSIGAGRLTARLVTYGLASFFGNLMLTTACRVDTFIINTLVGPAPLGVYSVAVNMAEMTLMIPAAIGVALFPHLTSQDEVGRVATVCTVARLSLCLGLISAAGVGLLGYPAIRLIFGLRFIGAYPPLLALLPGLVAMTTAYGYANYFSSLGRPLVNAGVFAAGIVVNIGLNVLVIPRYGIVGAGAVTSFGYLVCMGVFIALIARTACVPWTRLVVPRREDLALVRRHASALPLVGRFLAAASAGAAG